MTILIDEIISATPDFSLPLSGRRFSMTDESQFLNDPWSLLGRLQHPDVTALFSGSGVKDCEVVGTLGSGQPLASFTHDSRPLPIGSAQEALRFYEDNYDRVAEHVFMPGKRVTLGDKKSRVCRFCGKRTPEVTFKQEAHAIPELLGNRMLFTFYECDACNERFGHGIENDLGAWTLPLRTVTRIRGKNGYPAIKIDHEGKWRLEGKSASSIEVKGDDNPAFMVDEDAKRIDLHLRRGDYVPLGVRKAFVRIALTILPEEELGPFGEALEWICDRLLPDRNLRAYKLMHAFVPGGVPNQLLAAAVWRRKPGITNVPYATFVMMLANQLVQIFLPTVGLDDALLEKPIYYSRFPHIWELVHPAEGPAPTHFDSMAETTVAKGSMVRITSSFEQGIDRTTPPSETVG